jgi:putative methionine-R-sulfoxide reductase with GAF domain
MSDAQLLEDVRLAVLDDAALEERAARAAELIRSRTGRRWVGIYRVTESEVQDLAWSGPAAPAYPTFPVGKGLTGAAIASRVAVLSNDVANDSRYLTNQESTGSELIVPVLAGEQVVGTLDVEDAATNAFTPEDRSLFEHVGAALGRLFA